MLLSDIAETSESVMTTKSIIQTVLITSSMTSVTVTKTTDGAIAPPDRTGAIAGGVVAAIILLVVVGVIVVIAVCMCRRRRNRKKYHIEKNYDIPFNTLYYSE